MVKKKVGKELKSTNPYDDIKNLESRFKNSDIDQSQAAAMKHPIMHTHGAVNSNSGGEI